jgi:hypothetical protein
MIFPAGDDPPYQAAAIVNQAYPNDIKANPQHQDILGIKGP